jgi:hypothetical protein
VHEVWEWLFVVLCVGAFPATIILGLILRRSRSELVRVTTWGAWLVYSLLVWWVCLPQTERTNEPTGEGFVIVFLLRWGPFFAAVWLGVQHWLSIRAGRARGFAVKDAM